MPYKFLVFIASLFALSGCSYYIAPGAKADLDVFAPANIQAGFAVKATAPFPASIAAIRVQAPSYTNHNLRSNGGNHGEGRYTVITSREVEEPAQFDRIAKLAQVAGILNINRMLLPQKLQSDVEIREAASRLQADLVLIYTFDTTFYENDFSRPLTMISLGFAPTRKVFANTTASALLMDTRTGYVYSAYEITTKAETRASAWGSAEAADESRRQTEREAFAKLVDDFVNSWPKVLARHEKRG